MFSHGVTSNILFVPVLLADSGLLLKPSSIRTAWCLDTSTAVECAVAVLGHMYWV